MFSFLTHSFMVAIMLLSFSMTGLAFQGAAGGRSSTPGKPATTPTRASKTPTGPVGSSRGSSSGRTRSGGGRAAVSVGKPLKTSPRLAELTIITNPPDSAVLLNGKPKGNTDSVGAMSLSGLSPGRHTLLIRKPYHRDEKHDFELVAGQNHTETIFLTPLPGMLTVTPTIPGAVVEVGNVGKFPERVTNMSLTPGSYLVTVTKPGFRAATREVTITAGQPFTLPVPLEKVSIDDMLAQAKASFLKEDFRQASAISQEILSLQPENSAANVILGYSAYRTGDYAASVAHLVKAVRLGERIMFPVKHHYKYGLLPTHDGLTPGVLLIGKDVFEFRTGGLNATPVFSVPFNKIYRIRLEDNRGGRLQVKVGNPAKKKDDGKDYNFHPYQAGLQSLAPGNPNVPITVFCNNCLPAIQAVYEVLQQVAQPQ